MKKKIMLPLNESGVSCIECLDEERYAVGFNDGYVYAFWKGR